MGVRRVMISFEFQEYESLTDLTAVDRQLMEAAIRARDHAYAPYSGFNVGAAVLMENGELIIGNNQENASYPSGLCAERVAVFQAGALFPEMPIKAIAVTAASKNYTVKKPAAPCGNCRQAIAEYEHRQQGPIRLLFMGEEGTIIVCNSLADILPLAFDRSYLQ
ncbi:cytidine deaminase [Flavobacteriaceae bacterium F89]|uniref:Cytidine deaminase n=1 Tax=Cerina litoralis TaxID=2874477 RepID=A0AAE3JP29_9FLAO|nr:cytidine deaminase [Cerina litoralis]MCG2461700.1 cytidine deaminase [Cerina litoralis]